MLNVNHFQPLSSKPGGGEVGDSRASRRGARAGEQIPSMPHEPGGSRAQSRHSEELRDRGRGRPPTGGAALGQFRTGVQNYHGNTLPWRKSQTHPHSGYTLIHTHMHICEYT